MWKQTNPISPREIMLDKIDVVNINLLMLYIRRVGLLLGYVLDIMQGPRFEKMPTRSTYPRFG